MCGVWAVEYICGGVKAVAERWRRYVWAVMRPGTAEREKVSNFRGAELPLWEPLHRGKREKKSFQW
mgnify:CR=1 FL=1